MKNKEEPKNSKTIQPLMTQCNAHAQSKNNLMKTKRECNAHGDTKSNLMETQRALHKVQRMRVKMKNHARVPKQKKTLAPQGICFHP